MFPSLGNLEDVLKALECMIKFNSVDSFSDHHPQNTADQVLAILSLSWRQKVTMWRDGRIPASALEAPDDVDFCG